MSMKILAVDDSKTIRLIVAKALKPFDCTVIEAENGVTGLAMAGREKPDLILLDYTRPVMDGLEVLTRLRSEPDLKTTPVIMLTAEAGRDAVTKIARLGVRDYLIKPFKSELLVERVCRVLDLKAKSGAPETNKRIDDPISILVVDDKPAIAAQIRDGLADTPWKVAAAEHPGEAFDCCMSGGVDLVLASLLLPDDGAYMLFENLRGCSHTASIPVLGMCIRTTVAEQARAHQTGFAGIITKPINPDELKSKVCRTLKLETSYKYFHQLDGVLVVSLPKKHNPEIEAMLTSRLKNELTALVDAGGSKLIVDLSAVEEPTHQVIKVVVAIIQTARELSLNHAAVGSEQTCAKCRIYEESHDWKFAATIEQAVALLK